MAYNNFTQHYTQEKQTDTERFQQRFEAHITESREYRHAVRPPPHYSYLKNTAVYETHFDVEPCVAIHLPKHQFDRLMGDQTRMANCLGEAEYARKFLSSLKADEEVRNNNPVVKRAWEKYLMLLELARK
jgi:hypothetical protein